MSDQRVVSEPNSPSRVPWVVAAASWVTTLVLVVMLVGGGLGGGADAGAGIAAERGFSSAEDAAEAFAHALANGDADAAASMFATTSLVEGYSFALNVEYYDAFFPITPLPAPDFNGVNARVQAGYAGNSVISIVRSLLIPGDDVFTTYSGLAAEDISAWEDALSLDSFDGVAVKRVDVLTQGNARSQFPRLYAEELDIWSADEIREGAILFDTSAGSAMLGVTLIKIDGDWYVWRTGSAILGAHPNAAELTSEADYEESIARGQELIGN